MEIIGNNINAISPVIAAIVAALLGYGLTRVSKGNDARAAAETALYNSSPVIIAEQNKRIASLQGEIDRLWARLNEVYARERECQDELRECRHQVRDLGQKIIILERKQGWIEE